MKKAPPPVPNTEYNGINGTPTQASKRRLPIAIDKPVALKNGGKVKAPGGKKK